MTQEHGPALINPQLEIEENADGLLFKFEQDIPDDFVSELRAARIDADHEPIGEFLHFASIPVGVIDDWYRQGIDINNMDIRDVIRLLQKRELDALITTNKRLY